MKVKMTSTAMRGIDSGMTILRTIVNSPARELLNQDAELCRFDDEALLLHSKYLVLDRQAVALDARRTEQQYPRPKQSRISQDAPTILCRRRRSIATMFM